jgi:hypothetical protein
MFEIYVCNGKILRLLMYDKAGLWKIFFNLYQVPYAKVMTFPEANTDLKNLFCLFSLLLHKMNR